MSDLARKALDAYTESQIAAAIEDTLILVCFGLMLAGLLAGGV